MESNNSKFCLKMINKKSLLVAIKKIKKKKSSGSDGLSQEQLVMGAQTLADPLVTIINESVKTGQFPTKWKEAQITTVLKKVSSENVSNC